MKRFLSALWFLWHTFLVVFMVWAALNHRLSVYLLYQASGQLSLLFGTESFADYEKRNTLSATQKENIQLIDAVKKYATDSLGYLPTDNFTRIYDQRNKPVLWVVTACEPYRLTPYEWKFPLIGWVSYKGFFKRALAEEERNRLISQGYDTEIRSVSAWSTLGWLNDPVLSSMLNRSKGSLCNLLFHELFHATYFAPSSVNTNENLANFIADKATRRFLQNDTIALQAYVQQQESSKIFRRYMLRCMERLHAFYDSLQNSSQKETLKRQFIKAIADSVARLPLTDRSTVKTRQRDILLSGNAYFVGFEQYDSMQDSLEGVFNKIYKGNIEKMVQHLRLN